MRRTIEVNSAEYVCFHEAGHAWVALALGARPVEMHLYREKGVPPYGRTRVDRKDEQAQHIYLGGFAAEIVLYRAKLSTLNGAPIATDKVLIDIAYENASDDRANFWRQQLQGRSHIQAGISPTDMDQFLLDGVVNLANQMQVSELEPLAELLLDCGFLDEAAIANPGQVSSLGRWKLKLKCFFRQFRKAPQPRS